MSIVEIVFISSIICLLALYITYIVKVKKSYKGARDKKVATYVPGDGHKIYQLNIKTLDMDEVDPQTYKTEDGVMRKVVKEKDCIYCTALNEKNAIKKFSNMVNGKFEKLK